ncbi:endonuclease/exonuclease/phosphatase family protein [Fulvivirga sp.]|uniref:endonuclease/exonuclease/phosphatase family protein n=1 Tax=Fulvivirga sp. TaxID=1931237 RepID=UPI0032F0115A
MKKLFIYLLVIALTVIAIFSILGYFGRSSWKLDLFSHFKVQYLSILLPGTLILFLLKKKTYLVFLPFIFILIYEIQGLFYGGNKNTDLEETIKIVCINLLSSNNAFDEVDKYIRDQSPDIVILQEFNEKWKNGLETTFIHFKHKLEVPRNDNFGIAVYSKIELSSIQQIDIGKANIPSIIANFKLGQKITSLIATHPLPPVDDYYFENRNIQLNQIAEFVSNIDNEVILIGDLNTSSFSLHFKKLVNKSELIDSRKGFGVLPTWPTWFLPAKTTLDHCLVSRNIKISSRSVGQGIGSDHLPIVIEIGIK